MIKDWSKLVNLLPKEIKVDEFNRPLKRGDDINPIIELMRDEYGFVVTAIKHGTEVNGEEVDYNKYQLEFTNDDEEQVTIYMYGKNLNDLGIYSITYIYSMPIDNTHTRYSCDNIYQPIGIVTYTYNY